MIIEDEELLDEIYEECQKLKLFVKRGFTPNNRYALFVSSGYPGMAWSWSFVSGGERVTSLSVY